MGETGEGKRSIHKMENLSLETNRFPRDFLQRFVANPTQLATSSTSYEDEESEEIELNLGLSLGGRFGVDNSKKKLMRSSSIAGSFPIVRDDDVLTPLPVSYPSLMRTSSLPVETEEEWRKRKELQTLRRMAAKRRRSEKQRNFKNDCGGEAEANLGGRKDREESLAAAGNRFCSSAAPPLGSPAWAAAGRQGLVGGSGKGGYLGGSSIGGQGSIESQCGSSSGMSELESRVVQGSSGEVSPASILSLQEQGTSEAAASSGTKAPRSPCKRPDVSEKRGCDCLEDMPCVFTQGDGPNGRRIEGILYKYGKGEEVRIMCVCHGNFLSPAEFVKHAGGSDVVHPLKHIVVSTSSTSFL